MITLVAVGRMPPFLKNADALLWERYDAFILDLWGTVHDGHVPFPGCLAFLRAARAAGKRVVFLSNSPRVPLAAQTRLLSMGLDPSCFTGVVTAGGEAVRMVQAREGAFHAALGPKVYYYGPPPGEECPTLSELTTGPSATCTRARTLSDADFILMTDMVEDGDTVEGVAPFFARALALGLPIVAGNADNACMFGGVRCVCSGAVARWYALQGGRVHVHGKPSASVFDLARALVPDVPKARLCMVGDGLETDIKGANAYGIDSLLVLTGIHGRDFPDVTADTDAADVQAGRWEEELDRLVKEHGAEPTYWAHGLHAAPAV